MAGACIFGAKPCDAIGAAGTEWEVVEPMPTPRQSQASAVSNGKWYVAGGSTVPGGCWTAGGTLAQTFPTSIDQYDPATGHWRTVGQLSVGREFAGAVTSPTSGTVAFIGGEHGAGAGVSSVDVGTEGSWSSEMLPVGPQGQMGWYGHAVAFAAGSFLLRTYFSRA
jgi:N-acetylneuraminic acid mutarotase